MSKQMEAGMIQRVGRGMQPELIDMPGLSMLSCCKLPC